MRMKRMCIYLIVVCVLWPLGFIFSYGCLSLLDRNPKDHSTAEGPVMHDESSTTVAPDMQTLAWEIEQVRNTVNTSTTRVQNEIKPVVWMVIGIQMVHMLQDVILGVLQKNKKA